jgi:hypothetical protein
MGRTGKNKYFIFSNKKVDTTTRIEGHNLKN